MSRPIDPFEGQGEVRELARTLDWAETSLGPVDGWSATLRHTVRTALDSPFPVNLWCGPELVLIYNDAYRAVLGDKHPWSLGRPGSEVWAEIWEEIEPMFERIRAGGPPVFEEDAPFVVHRSEGPISRDDGSAEPGPPGQVDRAEEPNAWFTFSLSPVRDGSGEVVAFLNIVAERTGRILAERAREQALAKAERAESRLREVFAEAPAFLAVLRGPEHVFEYVNKAYQKLVGYRDLVGRPVMDALPELREQGFEELLDEVLSTGEAYVGREVPARISKTPGGELQELYLDFVYYPITEPDGTRSGVVAHGSDVTDHVRARREAQRARGEAERANRAKSHFLATMSHEIRTPINAVMGYADLLDAGVAGSLSDGQKAYVAGIEAGSRHLQSLVDDILDLAKIEAGEMVVDTREVEVRRAVEQAIRIVVPQARERDLTVRREWSCGEGLRVLADEDRVRQIMLNLLSNALKFTPEGGTVTVHCRAVDAAPAGTVLPELGPWFVVEVEDTGKGIAEEHLMRIFEPFVQADSGHTRQAGGTGLGLTISRRLARLMGGELTVRSEPGVGSCFSLWLASAVQDPVATAEPSGDEAEGEWPPSADELTGLAPAGRALLATLDQVEEAWVSQLRTDPKILARDATHAQLADQTVELVAAFAKSLYVLEEGGGDPSLLRDADAIGTAIAHRHGEQRRRLGWDRAQVEWQYHLLGEVLDATLRREAPRRTAADLGTALSVVHRLVARAADTSLAAFDDASDPPADPEPTGRRADG